MSDIKLFRTNNGTVEELKGTSVQLEKSLQTLIEQNLETFLGIRFLASEHSTGKVHGGRIDTLGIDENGYPVIIEYKRAINETVVLQGLYYLNWLMEHQADFTLLAINKLGQGAADNIEWSAPRLLCIAGDFTKYDEHAVQQMNRNIELIRYRRYGDDFLMFELVNAARSPSPSGSISHVAGGKAIPQLTMIGNDPSTVQNHLVVLEQAPVEIRDLFEKLKAFLLALGDDVQMRSLKSYIAFTRIKNIAYVHIYPTNFKGMVVSIKVDPSDITLEEGFTQMTAKGYIDIYVRNAVELQKAQPLLIRSYEGS